jgi:peptidyl-prolyl cis-trans isomerase SurA
MKRQTSIRIEKSSARLRIAAVCVILLGAAASPSSSGQTAPQDQTSPASSPVVLDRAVAVVNKRVILGSDLDDAIRLSVLEPRRRNTEITPQRALQQLISQTLIEQQMRQEDPQSVEPTQAEVSARIDEIRKELPICRRENCASDDGWQAFLAAHGLTLARVEAYVRYRLEILRFIERRFRQGIQISQQQIESYYQDTLLPQYKPGDTVPPLEQVAPRIQEILLQQQVSMLFDTWLTNLRQQGDVEVLDSSLEPPDAQPNAGNAGSDDQ